MKVEPLSHIILAKNPRPIMGTFIAVPAVITQYSAGTYTDIIDPVTDQVRGFQIVPVIKKREISRATGKVLSRRDELNQKKHIEKKWRNSFYICLHNVCSKRN